MKACIYAVHQICCKRLVGGERERERGREGRGEREREGGHEHTRHTLRVDSASRLTLSFRCKSNISAIPRHSGVTLLSVGEESDPWNAALPTRNVGTA